MKQQNDEVMAEKPRRRASDSGRLNPLRRFEYECLFIALLLPGLMLWLSAQSGLWHVNTLFADWWLAQTTVPVAHHVVVVELDEPCGPQQNDCGDVGMRGRELVSHLQTRGARAVLLEANAQSTPDGDSTALPASENASGHRPTIQHNLFPIDTALPADRDGLVRRLHLAPQSPQAATLQALTQPSGTHAGTWPDDLYLRWRMPTPSTADQVPVLSYAEVLMNNQPPDLWQNKLVIAGVGLDKPLLVRVGATMLPLPRASAYAQVLANLQHQQWVRSAHPIIEFLWIALPLWLTALLCLRWSEHAVLIGLAAALGTLAASVVALTMYRQLLPMATPLASIALYMMLWGWRRSYAVTQLFAHRIQRLDAVLAQMPDDADPRGPRAIEPSGGLQPNAKVEVLDHSLERLEAHHQIQRRMQLQRDRWLAFLSHDLRAPQANILSLVELREHGVEGMTDARFYGGIRLQVDRTLHLAEGFVDLLRAEADNLNRRHCLFEQLALDAVERCWPQAQAAQVRLVQRGRCETACTIYGDPELLTRAMVNILSNAIRHSRPGSDIEVCVAHDTHDHEIGWSVRDHGAGMDGKALADLLAALGSHTWLRPTRSRKSSTPRTHGMGLGLLVAHTVVIRHGGELHAVAAPDEGCHFIMALPASTESADFDSLSSRIPLDAIPAPQA